MLDLAPDRSPERKRRRGEKSSGIGNHPRGLLPATSADHRTSHYDKWHICIIIRRYNMFLLLVVMCAVLMISEAYI